jgi:hypothetical protein
VLAGLCALSAVTLALAYYVVMPWKFNPAPPAAHYPRPASALAAQRQDLDYFRKLVALDRSFAPTARAVANRRIDAMIAAPGAMARPQFRVALMRIAALADNGHTVLGSADDALPMQLPVRVAPFSDGFYVMYARDDHAALLGGRLLAIDGKPIEAVMRTLEGLKGGGSPGWRRYYTTGYLTRQDVLAGAGIAPDMRGSMWTVRTPDGRTVTQGLEAYAPAADEPSVFPQRWYSNRPLKGLDKGWQPYAPDAVLPITLRDFDHVFLRQRLGCAMLVQFKANHDEGDEKIADFIAATQKDMAASPPCNVILDLRFDGGGDYTLTYDFAHRLPDALKPGGRIYVLTGPAEFSAGITTAAFVKDAGGARVMLLGEPVGDRLAFFAEGGRGCLPNFHLCLNYQTGKHDYGAPCTDWDVCYWLNLLYPVRVKTLEPDEHIAMTFADWRAGRDPVFARALALASAPHP